MTNTLRFLCLSFSLCALSTHVRAEDAPSKDAVQIKNIFVPSEGYDDNDNIEFVLDGVLKNGCFRIGSSSTSFDGHTIDVKLEANRQGDKFCTQADASLPVAIQALVPFSKEVEIGSLKAGDYTIRFNAGAGNPIVTKTFKVGVAPTSRQDSMNYAPIDNASVESLVNVGDKVKLRLSGMLTSSCMHLRDEVLTKKEGDVVVVQPLVKIDMSDACLMYLTPFNKEIELPNLGKGRYLAHIRSMNGRALNRVFSVCSPDNAGHCANLNDRVADDQGPTSGSSDR